MNRRSSPIWNFFSITEKELQIATCDICKQALSFKSSVTNLKRHMLKKHPTVKILPTEGTVNTHVEENSQGQGPAILKQNDSERAENLIDNSVPSTSKGVNLLMPSNSNSTSTKLKKIQQTLAPYIPKKITNSSKKIINEQLMKLFYIDFQPFSVVEDKGFIQFVKSLNPSYELPSRKTISKSFIPRLYEECMIKTRLKVKEVLQVCVTTDCWTSLNNDSFNAITIHFIDENFKMQSILLKCAVFDKSHTIENLARDLNDVTEEWEIQNKILLAVSDNASNVKGAIKDALGWRFFGCYAHTLNLIVQNALVDVKSTIDTVKTVVSHFKRSSKSTSKLIKLQEDKGMTPKKLIQDVVTRWNSTYYMVDRFIELEEVVRSTVAILDTELPQLSLEEWQILKDLKTILEPFEDATRAVSGQQYMTASLVIVITGGLIEECHDLLKDTTVSPVAKTVIKKLENGLIERVGNVEYSNTLAMCTFLDPRFKTHFFRNADAVERVRKNVIASLADLITKKDEEESNKRGVHENKNNEPKSTNSDATKPTRSIWKSIDKIAAKHSNKTTSRSSTARAIVEVQRYMEDNILDRKKDPLQWWKDNEHLYPNMSNLVRLKCCAVATSVPCENLFSKAGNILNERRNRLSSQKLEQLLFLNYNSQFN